jgi:hypothetical protein
MIRLWTLVALAAFLALSLAACDADGRDRQLNGDDSRGLFGDDDLDGPVIVDDLDVRAEVEFTGVVEAMAGDEMVVSNCRLLLTRDTEIQGRLGNGDNPADLDDGRYLVVDVGDAVKVEAWLTTDDRLVAREVKVVDRDEVDREAYDVDDERLDDDGVCLIVQENPGPPPGRDGDGGPPPGRGVPPGHEDNPGRGRDGD